MLTVRTNTIKTTRDKLMHAFKKNGWKVQQTQYAPNGIKFL
jgi:tRNA G26 N,N-dimethylase Trm1